MNKFLTLNYYFNSVPDSDFHFTKLTLGIVAVFYILSIAIWIYRKKYSKNEVLRRILKKYPGTLFTVGTILLFLLLSRETGIPIISMRIWLLGFLLFVAIWFIKVAVTFRGQYRMRSSQAKQDVKSKYLPRKKNK